MKELDKQKLIDEAVIGTNGKWPSEHRSCRYPMSFLSKNVWSCGSSSFEAICSKDEFETRAKQLGYINGFRWGMEYPTNGKRPDIQGDVLIEFKMPMCNAAFSIISKEAVYLAKGATFKITDERYKPQDTGYLNASTTSSSLTHSEESLTHKDGEWWDYANDKPLSLPPAGVECERRSTDGWVKTSVVSHHFDGVRAIYCDGGFSYGTLGYLPSDAFRPLGYATIKAELERKLLIEQAYAIHYQCSDYEDFCEKLIDAGWRPTK